jgi:hypothetical protein
MLQAEAEAALWNATRALDEQVLLLDRLSQEAQGEEHLAATYQAAARGAEGRSNLLRRFIQHPVEEQSDF